MDLATYRRALGLSQAELASQVGITSASYICEVERRNRRPSLKLALRIERWSGGRVTAASLSPLAAELGASSAHIIPPEPSDVS